MENFDLKKFLVESKMTRNSRLLAPFLNENWQSLGISITPQENAKEMIVSLGSRRLAAEVVDEILKIEVLQERYKEYWRAVKSEILK